MKSCIRNILSILMLICLLSTLLPSRAYADTTEDSTINHYNVVILLDASRSMSKADGNDPNGYRYEAINQFISLLAEEGNYLGGVVFASEVDAVADMREITSNEDKEEVSEILSSVIHEETVDADGNDVGHTNIGEGLEEAVEMLLEDGNPDLPSIILFLSDGSTELLDEEDQEESLETKAEALETARENGITIHSVCLNATAAATSEMQQICSATGGEYTEISSATDLIDTMYDFYAVIYGTNSIPLFDDDIESDGTLEESFTVPGIGTEEVNIIIEGEIDSISLTDPNGDEVDSSIVYSTSMDSSDGTIQIQMLKVRKSDVVAGDWTLLLKGSAGEHVSGKMVFNSDLSVSVSADPADDLIAPDTTVTVAATLSSSTETADEDAQYGGFTATLQVMDAYGDLIDEADMEIQNGHLETDYTFAEGVYYYNVYVTYVNSATGQIQFQVTSETAGPVTASEEAIVNTAPTPVKDTVSKTIYVWPFGSGSASYTVDLSTLATDAEDSELTYRIVSSSFVEGTDYTLDDTTLTVTNFSLYKGSFDIQATDSGGLSCNIDLRLTRINVALVTALLIGLIALLVILGIIAFTVYMVSVPRFAGTITVYAFTPTRTGTSKSPRRGRYKLSRFGLENVGIDYNKCYFQATSKRYIYLHTNRDVSYNGRMTNKIRIENGIEITVRSDAANTKCIRIKFNSRLKGR